MLRSWIAWTTWSPPANRLASWNAAANVTLMLSANVVFWLTDGLLLTERRIVSVRSAARFVGGSAEAGIVTGPIANDRGPVGAASQFAVHSTGAGMVRNTPMPSAVRTWTSAAPGRTRPVRI